MIATDNINRCIEGRKWTELHTLLQRATNAEFRRVQTWMRTTVLPALPNDRFWETLVHLLAYRPQAFIASVVAVEHLAKDGTLDFGCEHAVKLAQTVSAEQVQKMVNMAVPLMQTEEQMSGLFHCFHLESPEVRIRHLVQCHGPMHLYLVFRNLQHCDNPQAVAQSVCQHYLKHALSDQTLNFVSMMKAYFHLPAITGVLPLRIEPYELSYMEQSYPHFTYVLEGKKPTILK